MNSTDSHAGPGPAPGRRLRVAVIGTGAIGQDLVHKVHRSARLECGLVAGRNAASAGLHYAARLGYPTTAAGIEGVLAAPGGFDVVFDATNAVSHAEHWRALEPLGTLVIDLTPSRVGRMVVPTVTGTEAAAQRNVNLISCGGQAAIPIVQPLAARLPIGYLEVVSTVASDIAGRATRFNLDEYVAATQHAVTTFTGVDRVKAILNISPAVPPASFRTTIHALVEGGARLDAVRAIAEEAAQRVRAFAPGYSIVACTVAGNRLSVTVGVTADSDVLPRYAGNLDIINSAAIMVAEQYATRAPRAATPQEARR